MHFLRQFCSAPKDGFVISKPCLHASEAGIYLDSKSWSFSCILNKYFNAKLPELSFLLYPLHGSSDSDVRDFNPCSFGCKKSIAVERVSFNSCIDSSERGDGVLFGFLKSLDGRFSGYSGMLKGSPDQNNTDRSHANRNSSRDEHPKGPMRHLLLGLKVCDVALLLLLTCYVIFFRYQVADRRLDALEARRKARGALLFWSGILLACGGSFLLLGAGLWLAFESGLNLLLSLWSGAALADSRSIWGLCACQLLSDSANTKSGLRQSGIGPSASTFDPLPRI
jgi:hypothetical protein